MDSRGGTVEGQASQPSGSSRVRRWIQSTSGAGERRRSSRSRERGGVRSGSRSTSSTRRRRRGGGGGGGGLSVCLINALQQG